MIRPYQTSDIIFWADVKLFLNNYLEIPWWDLSICGSNPETIQPNEWNLDEAQSFWYTCPVVEITLSTYVGFKLLFPYKKVFSYQKNKISSYDKYNQSYIWTIKTDNFLHNTNPTPCAWCGWYCDQTCHTWSSSSRLPGLFL